ncbi:hypothetical protein ON010_g13876 [Phytophthora cinnamomi]|nr:hypothetical protein ON010_g13876 [Phytophthora cinnamomi]
MPQHAQEPARSNVTTGTPNTDPLPTTNTAAQHSGEPQSTASGNLPHAGGLGQREYSFPVSTRLVTEGPSRNGSTSSGHAGCRI